MKLFSKILFIFLFVISTFSINCFSATKSVDDFNNNLIFEQLTKLFDDNKSEIDQIIADGIKSGFSADTITEKIFKDLKSKVSKKSSLYNLFRMVKNNASLTAYGAGRLALYPAKVAVGMVADGGNKFKNTFICIYNGAKNKFSMVKCGAYEKLFKLKGAHWVLKNGTKLFWNQYIVPKFFSTKTRTVWAMASVVFGAAGAIKGCLALYSVAHTSCVCVGYCAPLVV